MGFKLPGKSITSGTSAHRSALKMKKESMAKAMAPNKAMTPNKAMAKNSPMDKALVGKQENLPEDLKAKIEASPVKKDYETAAKNDPNLSEYVKNRKSLEKGSSEYGDNQYKINKAYYGEKTANRIKDRYNKKYNITTAPKEDDPLTKEIKDTSDVKEMGPKTQKQTIKEEKQDVKDVRKSGKESVKSAKKQKRINILKEKKDVSDAKGKSGRSKRLERKIERKETGITRREQRQRDKEI